MQRPAEHLAEVGISVRPGTALPRHAGIRRIRVAWMQQHLNISQQLVRAINQRRRDFLLSRIATIDFKTDLDHQFDGR
ncbi:hypothetical protein D3C73_1376730 [compost metagenome]